MDASKVVEEVSTHSRLKAAGYPGPVGNSFYRVSTHSRLKAAGKYEIWR